MPSTFASLFRQEVQPFSEDIRAAAQQLTFSRGEFVYHSGEPARGLYLVEEGLVGLIIKGPSGKEHLMRFFKEGQVFGHRSMLAGQNYHASTQVLEATHCTFIPKAHVELLITKYPEFFQIMVQQLAQELSNCELQQVKLLDQQILPRVAQALVFLKDIHPQYRWTRTELASFCASTTSTVIKALADLEYLGFIKQKGRDITILDRNALIQLQFQDVKL